MKTRFNKAMHQGPLRPRQLMGARSDRPMQDKDLTAASPLTAPPRAQTWRVAMTEPRREAEAREHLLRAGYAPWYPQETIIKTNASRRIRETVNVPLFARYIFVGLQPHATKPINGCKCVSVLLGYSVPTRLIDDLHRRQSGNEFVIADRELRSEGDRVNVAFGAFSELDGIVTKANYERVEVLVTIFGSQRTVTVDAGNVREIAA